MHQDLIKNLTSSVSNVSEAKKLIVISDTTEINYQANAGNLDKKDPNLGPVGNNKDIGFFMHPSIVIDKADKKLLGCSSLIIWNRSFDKKDKFQRNYQKLPIEQKESVRWINGAIESKSVLKEAEEITFVADREADIYDEFFSVPDNKCHLVIRSRGDRSIVGREQTLYEYIGSLPPKGKVDLEIKGSHKRAKRTANLLIKFSEVEIKKPKYHPKKEIADSIKLNAVLVEENETKVPQGEKPIRWILLTTKDVKSLDQALEVIDIYATRWQIEMVFATLKSKGMDVEASQLEKGRALKNIAVLSFASALKINQLRLYRDDDTQTPATLIFSDDEVAFLNLVVKKYEGQTAKQKNKHPFGTMAWAAWAISRLGGWKGYASESPPGNKTITTGWRKFILLYEGYSSFKL